MIDAKLTYSFSAEKNKQLVKERGVSFEAVIAALDNGKLLDIIENTEKYPHQRIYVIEMNGYAYLVPYVRKEKQEVFLKTIFPSRKLTRIYLEKREDLYD